MQLHRNETRVTAELSIGDARAYISYYPLQESMYMNMGSHYFMWKGMGFVDRRKIPACDFLRTASKHKELHRYLTRWVKYQRKIHKITNKGIRIC